MAENIQFSSFNVFTPNFYLVYANVLDITHFATQNELMLHRNFLYIAVKAAHTIANQTIALFARRFDMGETSWR